MRAAAIVGAMAIALAAPAVAGAQAGTPPAGSGTLSVSAQSVDHTGHRLTDGSYVDNGRSLTGALLIDVEYAVTRRIALSFTIPYVWARYTDANPTPFGLPPWDECRCWQTGWQDLGFSARYSLVDTFDHTLVITPLAAYGTPSHDYPYRGQAVLGRGLNELRIGTDASYRLDAVSRNLSINGHYTYAFVEKVIGISTNRSNAVMSADYRIGRNWSVGAFAAFQRTHGGLRGGSPPIPPTGTRGGAQLFPDLLPPGEINSPERIDQHDRLLRDNNVHVGAEVSYRIGRADVFGSFTNFLSGTDSHNEWAVMGGVTIPFTVALLR